MIRRKNGKKKGFSLIELIIVLAVMAIIALIAIPNFTAVRNNSKNKADTQSCEVIKRAVLMLVADDSVNVTKETDITFTTSVTAPAADTNGLAQSEIDLINEALKDVNAPQNHTSYNINITTGGDVTVTLK